MSRIKEHVDLLERMRQLVNGFPAVVARNEDGTYVHAQFDGTQQECPIWWQGEKLYQQLQEIKSNHEEEKRRSAKEVSRLLLSALSFCFTHLLPLCFLSTQPSWTRWYGSKSRPPASLSRCTRANSPT